MRPDDLQAPTITADGKRRWLYPDRRSGYFATVRARIAVVLMAIYLVTPFLSLGGFPLLRMDILQQRVFVLGAVFYFTEAFYFVFILIILALLLFLVTSLKGRLWCGYACPQTVFVEWLFRPIEELIQGPALQRRRQDQNPTAKVYLKKILTHLVFLFASFVVANAFLAYFVDPYVLLGWMSRSPLEHPYAFMAMLTILGLFYFDLAWFREQFCSFLCPYARFQSVMMDDQSPAVAYDTKRGDPRGKKAQGDCIDCGLCVRVCPTGIDIRDGLQLECIQCYRCVDACNMVMGTLERAPNLIKNASILELAGERPKRRIRIRPIIYASLLVLMVVLLASLALGRKSVDFTFIKNSGVVYSTLPDGRIANIYTLRAMNLRNEVTPLEFKFVDANIPGEIICGVCAQNLKALEHRNFSLMIALDPEFIQCGEIELEHSATKYRYKVLFNGKGC
jgi:cytochrome c oxidase accessory protein FixG